MNEDGEWMLFIFLLYFVKKYCLFNKQNLLFNNMIKSLRREYLSLSNQTDNLKCNLYNIKMSSK